MKLIRSLWKHIYPKKETAAYPLQDSVIGSMTELDLESTLVKRPLILAAGGTGGHVFPALAVAKKLKALKIPVFFITDERGARFCKDTSCFTKLLILPAARRGPLKGIRTFLWMCLSSAVLLVRWRPRVVWGFGGRMTVPVLLWGRCLGSVCGLHQSDCVLGKANRFLIHCIPHLVMGYPKTQYLPRSKTFLCMGTPVREGFEEISPLQKVVLPLRILVLGGSQGSAFWNTIVPRAMQLLSPEDTGNIHLVHQYGNTCPQYSSEVSAQTVPFIEDLPSLLESVHLVLSRAGASCLAELSVAGRPGFFVPYPFATDAHQKYNAERVVSQGGGWMCEEKEMSAQKLADFLRDCLHTPEQLLSAASASRSLGNKGAADRMSSLLIQLYKDKNHVSPF